MRRRRSSGLVLLALSVLSSLWLVGCGGPAAPETTAPPVQDLQAQAAAEATAIIQRAQATALVLQAEAEATALVLGAQRPNAEPTATVARSLPAVLPTSPPPELEPAPPPASEIPESSAGVTATVELLSVGFGAEGAYVVANYIAPPVIAQTFWPGVLSITDEASGTVFNEVPLVPLIGPLIARPIEDGQPGYFMVVHSPAILRHGSLVTVELAGYIFEHVPVQ